MARVSCPVFVGRSGELGRLRASLELAVAGSPTALLVTGEAGIGKTRLLAEFGRIAAASGARVLSGECMQLGETGLPFAPVVAALRSLVRELPADRLPPIFGPARGELAAFLPELAPPSRAAPAGESTSNGAAQARLFELLFGLFRRLADDQPLVLILEDLHWADPSTRDLLRFLVRSTRTERMLIVGSYRSDEMHRRHPLRPLVADLLHRDRVDVIELAAFGTEELTTLLTGLLGRRPGPELVASALARSGGNPLFVEERIAAGEARIDLPRSLREMIEERIDRLSSEARSVLRVAAVGGRRVDHRLLAEVVAVTEPMLLSALREAVEHHLLEPAGADEGPGYGFRHAVVHEVVYDELLPGERTRLHAGWARVIAARDDLAHADPAGTAAQLAQHWFMAHDLPRALAAAIEAARVAADGYAFAEAQAFLERALELWPKVPEPDLPTGIDRVSLLERAAEAAVRSGDTRRAIDLATDALDASEVVLTPERAGVLRHRLAWYLNEAGDWEAGVAMLEEAVQLIPIDPPTPARARVLADLAHSLMVRNRYAESIALAEAALAISRSVRARAAEARALTTVGLDLAGRSDLGRGVAALRDAWQIAVGLDDPHSVFLSAVGLGWALDEMARHEEAAAVARLGRARLRDLGAEARFGPLLSSKLGRALHDLGRWDEARKVLGDAIDAGPSRYAMRWLLSNQIRLDTFSGDFVAADRHLAAYRALGERVPGPDPDLIAVRRAELATIRGSPAGARSIVARQLELLTEVELDTDARMLVLVGLRAEAEEADLARRARSEARSRAAGVRAGELHELMGRMRRRIAASVPQPAAVIEADAVLAAALAATARGEASTELWQAAVDGRRGIGRPHELAEVLTHLAASQLAARRERREAAAVLREAHRIATRLGAVPLRERIEALARRGRLGLDGIEPADATVARLGLTPREAEVLVLLADGRSNRQIGEALYVTESTAGVHVSNILGKLGVASRAEAAAVAQRLGLTGAR